MIFMPFCHIFKSKNPTNALRAECFLFCFNDKSDFFKVANALKMKLLRRYFAFSIQLGIVINDISAKEKSFG